MKRIFSLALLSIFLALPVFGQTSSPPQAFTITIAPPPCTVTVLTLPAPPNGVADGVTAYGPYQFQAQTSSACTLPLTWAVTAGALPTGLTLSSAGVLSGKIAASACTSGTCSANFSVTATTSGTTKTNTTLKMNMQVPKAAKK